MSVEVQLRHGYSCYTERKHNMNIKELKSPYEIYPFENMTKWDKFKLWLRADVPYFFMNLWWKVTKKY